MTTEPEDGRIPFIDDLRAQLVGDAEPGLVAAPRGRRWQVAAAVAAAVLVAVGVGVVVERDGGDDVDVSAAPAVTPVLPVADLVGFVLEEALPWPPPGAATTDVRAEVWVAPGDGPVDERPSLLLLTVANPDITDLADDDVASGNLVRGHLAEDATLDSDVPVDAGSLWVERPGLAVTVAVRGADPALVAPVAEGLDLDDGIADGAALDPATLPDGWARLFAPVELTFFGAGLPLGPGADGYAMAFRSTTDPDALVSAFVTAGGADDLLALEWLYGAEVNDVRGHRAVAGASEDGSRYLAWREDDATLVTLVGFNVDADGLAAIAASLGPSTEGELVLTLDQLQPTDDGGDDSASAGTATTSLTPDPAGIHVATLTVAGRPLELTLHPDGWPFQGTDVPVLCATELAEGVEGGRPQSCGGIALAAPDPVSVFLTFQEAAGGWWSATGWVDPSVAAVVVHRPDGTTTEAQIVELVSRSTYPFPGSLWIAGGDGDDVDLSTDGLVVEALAADGTSLGTTASPSSTETTAPPDEQVIPLTTTSVGDRTIEVTFRPGGFPTQGIDVPAVCYDVVADDGSNGTCTGALLGAPNPISLFSLGSFGATSGEPGIAVVAGWASPDVASVAVVVRDGSSYDADVVELVTRSTYPFPGNLWLVVVEGPTSGLVAVGVDAFGADGSPLGGIDAAGATGVDGSGGTVVATSAPGEPTYELVVIQDPGALCIITTDSAAPRQCDAPPRESVGISYGVTTVDGVRIAFGWVRRGATDVRVTINGIDHVATVHPIEPGMLPSTSPDVGAFDAWSGVIPDGEIGTLAATLGPGTSIEIDF
jgi:hypothetical protein